MFGAFIFKPNQLKTVLDCPLVCFVSCDFSHKGIIKIDQAFYIVRSAFAIFKLHQFPLERDCQATHLMKDAIINIFFRYMCVVNEGWFFFCFCFLDL